MRTVLLSTAAILLRMAPLAQAQLAINVPVTPEMAPDASVPPAPGTMVTPPPAMGSSPGSAAGTADASTTVVFWNGIRQRVKTYSDYAAVRAFDAAQGTLSLDDGTTVSFPSNFAFLDTPQPGQPVTVYYFQDPGGTLVLSAIDMGTQGTSNGS